jgi:osmotically-inducible protein OsmY
MASQGAGRRWPWSRLLLLASFILQSCDHAQQRADDELANRIDQALLASDELNLSRIEVSVESGLVYLSGMSDDHASKVHAEKEAQAVPGVQRILNKIEVDF